MSDELLTTALCWELDDRVSAEYAHAQRSLTFYCPDPACVAKIVPTKIRNVFFRAPGRHERGCRWEKEISESSALPGTARPKPSPLLPAGAPTLLGPGPAIRRRLPPTVAELQQLAERLERAPIVHPGTLPDIVEAWCDMTTDERAAHPLSVADRVGSYATGFLFLPKVGRDISNLNCDRQIVFGAADVKLGSHVFFVTTLKKFETEAGSLPISIRVPRDVPSSEGLGQLVGESVTAFWHGRVPSKDRQGRYFSVTAPDETIYDGLVVKRGHLLP